MVQLPETTQEVEMLALPGQRTIITSEEGEMASGAGRVTDLTGMVRFPCNHFLRSE